MADTRNSRERQLYSVSFKLLYYCSGRIRPFIQIMPLFRSVTLYSGHDYLTMATIAIIVIIIIIIIINIFIRKKKYIHSNYSNGLVDMIT